MEANDNHEEEHTVPRVLQVLEPGMDLSLGGKID